MSKTPIQIAIQQALSDYIDALEGESPKGVYELVQSQVESAMLETVMQYANQNHLGCDMNNYATEKILLT